MKVIDIKITKEEYNSLVSICETDGAEVLDYDGEYDSLINKGLILLSGARGPSKQWRRAIPTDIGKIVGSGLQVNVTIEGVQKQL